MKRFHNNYGFAISTLLYPAFVIIVTLIILTLVVLTNSTFSISKLMSEISGDISDNNTMKSLKENLTAALKETNSNGDVKYYAIGGGVYPNLYNKENTTNWNGNFLTKADGTELAYIDNSKYCAYKLYGMSGIAVYNSNECLEKIADTYNCADIKDLICTGADIGVVAYTSRDSLPTVGPLYNIAVISSTAVGKHYINNQIPSSPTAGDVWVKISNFETNIRFKSYSTELSVDSVKQYDGINWNNVEAYQYYDSKWNSLNASSNIVDGKEYIFNNGTFYIQPTVSTGYVVQSDGTLMRTSAGGQTLSIPYMKTGRHIFVEFVSGGNTYSYSVTLTNGVSSYNAAAFTANGAPDNGIVSMPSSSVIKIDYQNAAFVGTFKIKSIWAELDHEYSSTWNTVSSTGYVDSKRQYIFNNGTFYIQPTVSTGYVIQSDGTLMRTSSGGQTLSIPYAKTGEHVFVEFVGGGNTYSYTVTMSNGSVSYNAAAFTANGAPDYGIVALPSSSVIKLDYQNAAFVGTFKIKSIWAEKDYDSL
jgi:hypothetical protein